MRDLAVIVLTFNEEENLLPCIESLRPLDCEVFVVDSGSTDRTVGIAREAGAAVLFHRWETYASQFNWALDHIPSKAPWVLRIDADERLSAACARSLAELLPGLSAEVTGLYLGLRIHFLGRWLRHGGLYPVWLLRVWRRDAGRCEDRWMDEHISLSRGRCMRVRGDLIHENRKGIHFWIEKHNGYATREGRDLVETRTGTSGGLSGQASAKRWIKENGYTRLPLFLRAWLYWAWRYILRLGFLDGIEGALFHFFQALWYRSLVDAKLLEARRKASSGGGQ